MAKFVHEIMNPELFSVEPEAPREDVLGFLLALDITACPVMDVAGKLLGMVSVRDLMQDSGDNRARDRMGEPATTIDREATIEEAGRKLADDGVHRLVVTDAKGRAVGMLSAVDLVAALVGMPARHPPGFPHVDAIAKVSWSDDAILDEAHVEVAPEGPGVVVLVYGEAGRPEVPVWAEDATNLRARVDAFLSGASEDPRFIDLMARSHRHLRFRTSELGDPERRKQVVSALRDEMIMRRIRG